MTDAVGGVPFGPAWSASLARVPAATLEAWLAFGHAACDAGDAIALAHFRRDPAVERKPDRTLVTAADRGIEAALRERIRAAYPDHGVLGEEEAEEGAGAPTRWILDPIDGTHNFVRGIPVFATLLAVEHAGELQAAVVSAPAMGERWWAARGLGAWHRDRAGERRIRVSGVTAIADAQVLAGSGRDTADSGLFPGFDALLRAAWRERGFGDFWAYLLVAEGAAEAMAEAGPKPYDVAAPLVVLEEAGGRLTDHRGLRTLEAPGFVATNGHLHDEVLRRLAG